MTRILLCALGRNSTPTFPNPTTLSSISDKNVTVQAHDLGAGRDCGLDTPVCRQLLCRTVTHCPCSSHHRNDQYILVGLAELVGSTRTF